MRKSSLILLLAMAFVLTTVAAGFCSTIIEGPCKEVCEKCWGYNLFIEDYAGCTASTQTTTGSCADCPMIDYESSLGYCMSNSAWAAKLEADDVACDSAYYNAAGVILKVCDCTDLPDGEFSINKSYGIKIEIVEPASGVYFTDRNTSAGALLPGCNLEDSCGTASQRIYVANLGDTTNEAKFCPDCEDATTFAMGYTAITGQLFTDAMQPEAGDECCLDCVGNLATAIKSTCNMPFMYAQSPYIMVDIPTMVWDPKRVAKGDVVKVKVTITGDAGDEVCSDCTDLCSCIVEVGIFGCPESLTSCEFCLPYFTALDSGWWSGFALTNAGPKAADCTVTFYAGGDSVDVTVNVPANSVEVRSLSQLDLGDLDTSKYLYANVKAVGAVDEKIGAAVSGFAIMGDNAQAYGYLSKPNFCGCDSCK